MKSTILRPILAAAAVMGVAGCTSYDDGYGYGYNTVSVGYGTPYYGGYGSPYYRTYGNGYYGSYAPSYYGWYNGYYYPGAGYYIYDNYGSRYRWSEPYQTYWMGRRTSGQRYRENWSGYRREGRREYRRDYRRRGG